MPKAPLPRLLHVAQLTLTRGRKTLLHAVDWTIHPGQHWVIMGPNGCGKTSLLRALTGFLTPSGGKLELLGYTYGATDWREVRHSIGLVSSALQAHIPPGEVALETVISGRYDQLDFWGQATSTDERSARTLLRKLGVSDLADRPWAVLSQGERQRVLIARALAARPRILILDEPCAGLDPVARADFLAVINALTTTPKGPALVLVTHHVEEITSGFSHALLLAQGRNVAAGPLAQVITSSNLSQAFGRPLQVRRQAGAWQLRVTPAVPAVNRRPRPNE